MIYTFSGGNPTQLYLSCLYTLRDEGDLVAPRGKQVKEIRPAVVEFLDPYKRMTHVFNRRINPFFQLAESLWILTGRADVGWLKQFNEGIAQFSDDGKWFNAPYGERIRTWNKNSLHNQVFNPIDQMYDAYRKLTHDKDTRQAVIVISNPWFDNSKYTIDEHGKDIACNLLMTWKIRHDKLNLTVFNRSNDVHWGLFGANLCQFSTIQEQMLAWLQGSGEGNYDQLEMGTYTQMTDSLHMYLDSYGAKCTEPILEHYGTDLNAYTTPAFVFPNEPRMTLNYQQFEAFSVTFWGVISPLLEDNNVLSYSIERDELVSMVEKMHEQGVIDDYWYMAINLMLVYRLVKTGDMVHALQHFAAYIPSSQYAVSCLYFLKHFVKKELETSVDAVNIKNLYLIIQEQLQHDFSVGCDSSQRTEGDLALGKYLALEV